MGRDGRSPKLDTYSQPLVLVQDIFSLAELLERHVRPGGNRFGGVTRNDVECPSE